MVRPYLAKNQQDWEGLSLAAMGKPATYWKYLFPKFSKNRTNSWFGVEFFQGGVVPKTVQSIKP